MKDRVRTAFLAVRNGFSPDRVIADPELNAGYLRRCRLLGLSAPDAELNRALLNTRKAGGLSGIQTTRQTSFKDAADYAFASEIAIRFLERRDGVTLDQVICAPNRAAEFDNVAARICPGFSQLQYRWAALNLRKKRHLRPERVGHVCPPTDVMNFAVCDIDPSAVPVQQGLYVFFDSRSTLYVGETANLRKRLKKHLDHSDNKGLAHWLWERGTEDLNVELHLLPESTSGKVRRALEGELIESRRPVFNVQGREPSEQVA